MADLSLEFRDVRGTHYKLTCPDSYIGRLDSLVLSIERLRSCDANSVLLPTDVDLEVISDVEAP